MEFEQDIGAVALRNVQRHRNINAALKTAAVIAGLLILIGAGGASIIWIGLLGALYFLPAIVAHRREHHNKDAIAVLNLFLGWTFIGWVVALVWAKTN